MTETAREGNMIWCDNPVPVRTLLAVPDDSFSTHVRWEGDGQAYIQSTTGCREVFDRNFRDQCFYWSHPRARNAAAFLSRVEDRLGLPLRDRVRFRSTTRNCIVQVRASRWWMANPVRKSVLTVFLRCGVTYVPEADNFDEALWSTFYTRSTKWATRRFLAGCTVPTVFLPDFYGWVAAFGMPRPTFLNPLVCLRREHPRLARAWCWLNDPKARKTSGGFR